MCCLYVIWTDFTYSQQRRIDCKTEPYLPADQTSKNPQRFQTWCELTLQTRSKRSILQAGQRAGGSYSQEPGEVLRLERRLSLPRRCRRLGQHRRRQEGMEGRDPLRSPPARPDDLPGLGGFRSRKTIRSSRYL